jgi:hypothetical protein
MFVLDVGCGSLFKEESHDVLSHGTRRVVQRRASAHIWSVWQSLGFQESQAIIGAPSLCRVVEIGTSDHRRTSCIFCHVDCDFESAQGLNKAQDVRTT